MLPEVTEMATPKVNVEDAITDLQLMNVAQEIGPEQWRHVGLQLGLSAAELGHLEHDHRTNLVDRTYHMLIRWRQDQVGAEEALRRLHDALSNVRLGSVARQLAGSPNSSNVNDLETQQLRRELQMKYVSHLCTTRLLPWDSRSRVAIDRYFTEIRILLEDTSVRTHEKVPLERHRHDIFTISGRKGLPTNRILLQGKPGTGKSTLVAKIALDWMSGHPKSPLKELPVLFVLPLHKLNEGSNVGAAIREHLLPEDTTFTEEAINKFIKCNPSKVMIILDGLDQLSKGKCKSDNTESVLKVIENKRLTECKVLVTSRRWRVSQLRDSTLREYTLLEMEGFVVEDIFSYVLTFFQDDEAMAQSLIRCLEASPIILQSICPFPLFCPIVCHLWEKNVGKTGGGDRLGTSTELTDQIVRSLWTHHESKHTGEDDAEVDRALLTEQISQLSRFSSFCLPLRRLSLRRKRLRADGIVKGLPVHPLSSTLCRLGKVALEKLLSSDPGSMFHPDDVKFCREYINIGLVVGLLSHGQVSSSSSRKKSSSVLSSSCVYFSSNEIMQKCAAVYFASLWKKNHAKFTDVLARMKNKFIVLEFELILLWACGEDANVAKEILEHLSGIGASHDIILKCYFESPEDDLVDEVLALIFKEYFVALSSPGSASLSALTYFLQKVSAEDSSQNPIKRFLISEAPLSSMRRLAEIFDADYFPKLTTVSLAWCDLENANTPLLLTALGNLPALSDMTMTGSTIGPTFIENIGQLPPGCFQSLLTFELPIGSTCAEAVLRAVFCSGQFPVLQKIYLTIQDICLESTQHVNDEQNQLQKPPSDLRTVSLTCSDLGLQASIFFADTLTDMVGLKTLSIVTSTFHREFFRRLGEVPALKKLVMHMTDWKNFELETFLRKLTMLHHVEINSPSSTPHDDVRHKLATISRVIPSLTNLSTLHVSVGLGCHFSIDDASLGALCESLKTCAKLNRIIITGMKMTPEQGVAIINSGRSIAANVVSLSGCFRHKQDVSELNRLRNQMSQEKTMVVEF